jgi:HemY protein
MRLVLWLLLLIALAVGISMLSQTEHGYVLVVLPPWRVELSLTMAAAVAILVLVVGYVIARVLRTALRLPHDVRSWRIRRRRGKAESDLNHAVGALLAGQPEHARKLARRSLEREATPLAALVAARASLDLGERETARGFLDSADSDVGELVAARQALEDALSKGGAEPVKPSANQ